MTSKRTAIACPREPIGLSQDEAARYVGMSPTLFALEVGRGTMPCPRRFGQRKIWDAEELAAAFRRRPHETLDLKPGVRPPHDDVGESDPYDRPFEA